MTTEPSSKKIKPEEDDSLKKDLAASSYSSSNIRESRLNMGLTNNPHIEFLCLWDLHTAEIRIQLPNTFSEFRAYCFADIERCVYSDNYLHWSHYLHSRPDRFELIQYYYKWSISEILIQYYDETIHNCINLDEENWLEYRNLFLQWSVERRLDLYPYPVKLIITHMKKREFRRVETSIAGRSTVYISDSPNKPKLSLTSWDKFSKSAVSTTDVDVTIGVESDNIEHLDRITYGSSKSDDVRGGSEKIVVTETAAEEATDIETPLDPLPQYTTLRKQKDSMGTKYSFICLLTKTDALDELNYLGCQPRIFNEPYECLLEIVKAVDQKLILIISQSLSKHFVPLIHDLIQIIYIYILHRCDSYHENGDDNYVNDARYPKVRGSFIERTMLKSKLNDHLQQLSNILLRQPVLTDSSQMKINNEFYVIAKQPSSLKLLIDEEKDFVLFQLIIKAIRESGTANPLNDPSTALRLHVRFPNENEDPSLWKSYDKFRENYVPEKAISIYLSDTSLRYEVNTCFRNKNKRKIFELWFFIRDLLKQMPYNKKSITVYRAQYLTINQIETLKNNIGSLITFTKFFSMSTSNIRAICRREDDQNQPELMSMVFQLEIRNDSASTRFSMTMQSYEEAIYLFPIGTVFCIESIEELKNQVWRCKLSIDNDNDSILTRMFQHYVGEIGTPLTYLSLGIYLNALGEEDLALQYYETLQMVTEDSDINSAIYNNLAIIYEQKNDLSSARKAWEQASKLQKMDTLKMSTLPLNQKTDFVMAVPVPHTSPIINHYNLACVYQQAEYFDEALKECEKAFNLPTNKFDSDNKSDSGNIALVHSAMGSVYFSQKKYENALKSFEMALENALIHLPPTNPLIDQYLNNIRLLKNMIIEKESDKIQQT